VDFQRFDIDGPETGLEKTVRWYLDRRDWWTPLRGGVCRGERLGLPGVGQR
jgi:dTDP-glucose 4,6-dehydratase